MKRILVVEDDRAIADGLTYSLEDQGYQVETCGDVESALKATRENLFDLAILDVSLPDGSGYDICRDIKTHCSTPVIFLTVLGEESQVVHGLDIGADDYVTKPFRLRELLSRVRTVLRRANGTTEDPVISLNALQINTKQALVTKNGVEVSLTALEYRLLVTLAANRGQLLTRNQLIEDIWDISGEFVNDNTLTVYIKRLRDKIEDDPQNPVHIRTVRGLGYRFGG